MRELLDEWFGPVLDADGNRVRVRTSRPALALHVASMACYAATAVLSAMSALPSIDIFAEALWPATFVAATLLGIASRARLRRTVRH